MSSKDPSAEFIQLLTGSQSRLFAYSVSMMGNRQQAQEVMQETNLVMWRKADQFEIGTNFPPGCLRSPTFKFSRIGEG